MYQIVHFMRGGSTKPARIVGGKLFRSVTVKFAQIRFYTYGQSFVGGFVVRVVGNVVVVPEIISCKSEEEYNTVVLIVVLA